MKLRVSMAANFVLLVAAVAMAFWIAAHGVGDFYYRKMVGSMASRAVHELDNGRPEIVRQALSMIPSDPDDKTLAEANRKLGDGPP